MSFSNSIAFSTRGNSNQTVNSTSFVAASFGSASVSSPYITISSNEITFNIKGIFEIYSTLSGAFAGTVNAHHRFRAIIQKEGMMGFEDIPASLSENDAFNGRNQCSVSVQYTGLFDKGDNIRIAVARNGSNNFTLSQDYRNINIKLLEVKV